MEEDKEPQLLRKSPAFEVGTNRKTIDINNTGKDNKHPTFKMLPEMESFIIY